MDGLLLLLLLLAMHEDASRPLCAVWEDEEQEAAAAGADSCLSTSVLMRPIELEEEDNEEVGAPLAAPPSRRAESNGCGAGGHCWACESRSVSMLVIKPLLLSPLPPISHGPRG